MHRSYIFAVQCAVIALANGVSFSSATAQRALPTARMDVEALVQFELAERIALRKARQLWGEAAPGQVVCCSDENGDIVAYLFPFRIGEGRFLEYEEMLGDLKTARSDYLMLSREAAEPARSEEPGLSPKEQRLATARARERGYTMEVQSALTSAKQRMYGSGDYGAVYVSARRDRYPIPLCSHYLPPYYAQGDLAEEKARELLGSDVTLNRYYFLGRGGGQYFEFVAGGRSVLLHAFLLETEADEKVLQVRRIKTESSAEMQRDMVTEWGNAEEIGLSVDHLIENDALVPDIEWCRGCTPTSASMVIGYWDNYVGGIGYSGYGRLIDYWQELRRFSDGAGALINVPNILEELRVAMKTDRDGITWTSMVSSGIEYVCNLKPPSDLNNGYSSTPVSTAASAVIGIGGKSSPKSITAGRSSGARVLRILLDILYARGSIRMISSSSPTTPGSAAGMTGIIKNTITALTSTGRMCIPSSRRDT